MTAIRLATTVVPAAVLSLVAAAACGGDDNGSSRKPTDPSAVTTTTAEYRPAIDPADFVDTIDNPYLPLTPGATRVYEGESDGEMERIEVTVTSDSKEVMGVACVVVRDTVSVDGEVIEDTYDWFAQDREGNVWYFGEDSKEYENGEFVSAAGSWEAGVDGAQPGIIMPAEPKAGDTYRQEYYAGEAEDMGEIARLGESVTVPVDTYEDVLVTRDWTPLEPGIVEEKYYAPGVGVVLEEKVEGGSGRVELVELTEAP